MSMPASYLRYLPAAYAKADDGFLARYLTIFQKLLTGIADGTLDGRRGIQELLAADVVGSLFYSRFSFLFPSGDDTFIPPISGSEHRDAILRDFDSYIGVPELRLPLTSATAANAQDDDPLASFSAWLDGVLDWLAGWVNLLLDGSWSLDRKREVIAQIMALYRLRGTAQGMNMMLDLFLDLPMEVSCYTPPGSKAVTSTVSIEVLNPSPPDIVIGDTAGSTYILPCAWRPGLPLLSGYAPWLFLVQVMLPRYSDAQHVLDDDGADQVRQLLAKLPVLLDAIKPAACRYQVQILGGMCFQPSPVSPPPAPSLPDPKLDFTTLLGSTLPSS
ncbi:phage tail protein [Dyella sp. M7H15-1]|uniref:phage tail protein n=1 Tax=Dyella sp. M7H15-1 TaxID=2501295 RepID=UPI0013E8C831|nr:phage tail protein [Dyella sp. M7H15-1]